MNPVKRVIISSFPLLLIVVLGLSVWISLRSEFVRSENYRLLPDRFHITEPPPWISDTFIEDVLEQSGLDQQETILDSALPGKLAAAFAANPWVSKVHKVQMKYPATVHVDLEYREPCCLIAIPGELGYYPIDPAGILLPTDYFTGKSPGKISDYIVVHGVQSHPLGSVGDSWGDPIVEQIAKIAVYVHAKELNVVEIKVVLDKLSENEKIFDKKQPGPPQFKLITESGQQLDWNEIAATGHIDTERNTH